MIATLAEPKPLATPAYEDGDFIDFGYVPVFKEHTDRDGNEFNSIAMERIAARCNERIDETGDFAPLVINHTSDNSDADPEVVGFVGPYRLGKVGNKNPRVAILGRLRVFKRDADRVRKYPRLSVELWSKKDDPTNGFFDPVSLLGATTPELDLGIRFAKDRLGYEVRKYSRMTKVRFEATPAAPGGGNTFIPGGVGGSGDSDEGKERKKTYESSPGGMLSEADIQQIISALKPVVEEAVDARMAAMKPADPMAGAGGAGGADQFAAGGAGGAGGMGADAALGGAELGGDAGAAEMAGGEAGEAEAAMGDEEAGDADDADEFGADDEDFDNLEGDASASSEGSEGDSDDGDDVNVNVSVDADDDDSDDDGNSPDKPSAKKKKKYSADANAGGEFSRSDDSDKEPAMADMNVAAEAAEQVKRYQKERDDAKTELSKVTKERDEIRTKYQKEVEARRVASDELAALKPRIEKLELSERRAVRYQKLSEIAAKGYTFDVEEEIEDAKDMSDDQFTKHCERIVKQYQRVPTDMLPVAASDRLQHAARVKGAGDAERREKYSKIAQENCLKSGKHSISEFKAELDRLLAEDDEKNKAA